jgi:hypothetical protein
MGLGEPWFLLVAVHHELPDASSISSLPSFLYEKLHLTSREAPLETGDRLPKVIRFFPAPQQGAAIVRTS